jgi:hypothetical protein
MTVPVTLTGDQLASELERLGVDFVQNSPSNCLKSSLEPDSLLAGLAASPEARMRLAIIPLLLHRPEYAVSAAAAEQGLSPSQRTYLHCYYTAAFLLQKINADSLSKMQPGFTELPDLFSVQLGIAGEGDPWRRLEALARRQAQLSGEAINWLGTYIHAVEAYIHTRKLKAVWTP